VGDTAEEEDDEDEDEEESKEDEASAPAEEALPDEANERAPIGTGDADARCPPGCCDGGIESF
jgi:hypothetical protein